VVQAGVQETWVATYNGGLAQGTNQAVAMALDSQGNIIVTGSSTSNNSDFDYVVIKYALNGTALWTNRYDSPNHGQDEVRSMKIDHEDAVVVCGTTKTVKFRRDGAVEWVIDYAASNLAIDGAGDVYLVGHRPATYATLKVAASGTNLWERTASFGFGPNYSQIVCLDTQTNVYVAGWINCSPDPRDPTYRDERIVSYDALGNERWVSTQGLGECIGGRVELRHMVVDSFGHLTYAFNQQNSTFAARSYKSDGTFRWEFVLDSGLGVTALADANDGDLYLTGLAAVRIGPGQYLFPYSTVKINGGGSEVWSKNYGTSVASQFHYAQAIGLDRLGNVTVTGVSPGNGNDIATVQYSSEGEEKWVKRYDGPMHGDDGAKTLVVGPQGEIYVAGYQTSAANLVELVVIKYSERANITMQPNKTASLQFPGTPGATNRVQATTDFLGWLDLGFTVADTNGLLHFQDTNAPAHPFRFYRTVTP
jgi:hypothetical protein